MTTKVPYQLLSPDAQTALTAFRNKIINGDFRITQRGVSGTIAPGGSGYTADRWLINNTTNQTLTWSVATSQAYGRDRAENYLALSFASAPTTGTVLVQQRIEDVHTLVGDTSLAFDMIDFGSIAGTQVITQFEQIFGSGGSAPSYSAQKSATVASGRMVSSHVIASVAGKTIGADNFVTAFISFTPRATGYWVIGSVQAESGKNATPFEQRHLASELVLCQRYYESISYLAFYVPGTTATLMYVPIPFKVRKRSTPSVGLPSSTNAAYSAGGTSITPTTWTVGVNLDGCRITVGSAGGVGGIADGTLTASAEL